jgi:thiamine biosynthesis lipoprotein
MTPNRRQWLHWALGTAGAAGAAAAAPTWAATLATNPTNTANLGDLVWRERAMLGFGTTLWLRAAHVQAKRAERALDDTVTLLRHLHAQMSLFDADSAVSRLNREGHLLRPDPDLLAVLQLARQVSARSQGAFDITVQPLWALWQQAHGEGRRPTAEKLAEARTHVNWRAVRASEAEVALTRPGMAITLNGIAQGYAAERARALMRRHGIANALLDTGEWAPMGRSPDGGPWRLGLASPRDSHRILRTLQADGRGIAVSTDATLRFGTDAADDREHHILNPHTGHSPLYLSAVAVIAESPALADALTKVVFMGTADQAMAQAQHWGVDVIAVDKGGRVSDSRAVGASG